MAANFGMFTTFWWPWNVEKSRKSLKKFSKSFSSNMTANKKCPQHFTRFN